MFEYDHIINKEKLEEADNIEDVCNRNSKHHTKLRVEKVFLDLKKAECLQLERRGYFIVDSTDKEAKTANINYIPDGKSNPMSKIAKKVDVKSLMVGTETGKKSKKQEKKAENQEKKDKKKEQKKANTEEKKDEVKEVKKE